MSQEGADFSISFHERPKSKRKKSPKRRAERVQWVEASAKERFFEPQTKPLAEKMIKDLRRDIEDIRIQLGSQRHAETFQSDQNYESWRGDARAALAIYYIHLRWARNVLKELS